ncbi:MAG: transporter substrate-binding domain-containing protein [Spirochaetaceae bacterium]
MKKIKQLLPFVMMLIPFSSLSALELPKEIVLADSDLSFLNSVVQEVGTRAFGKYNIKFSLKTYPSKRALLTANSGQVDGDAYRVYDLYEKTGGQYPNLIRVDVPYISIYFTAFVKDKGIKITGWEDLTNYRVTVIRGNKTMETQVDEFVPPERQAVVGSYKQAFTMLEHNRVDIVVGKPIVGADYVKKYNLSMTGKFQFQEIYMYLHKKHEQLIPKIKMELQKMKDSGELQDIEKMVRDRFLK